MSHAGQPKMSTRVATALAAMLAFAATAPAQAVPAPRAPTRAAENQITVGSIPLTLAPGWHIARHDRKNKSLLAVNGNDKAGFSLQEDNVPPGTPIANVLNIFYKVATKKMTNAQSAEPYDAQFTGSRFQESLAMQYSGDEQTQRGSAVIVGVLAVLLNPATGNVGLIRVWAHKPEHLDDAMKDAVSMTDSTLN